jgi:type III pantothenate kinase
VNLIIEQGNTSVKVAIYDKGRIEASFRYNVFDASAVKPFFDRYALKQGIMSTVIEPDGGLLSLLKEQLSCFILLDEQVSLPITIQYQTPATLGKDRLAAVVGANYLQPGKDILVIDAGTAITYELVDAKGAYIGGNISPGMTTRFKALHHFTRKLPLVCENDETIWLGNSTETAIQAGVVNGIIYEMDGYINDLRLKYPKLFVFLTGGHSIYFEKRLKSVIFADINLVLTGLNRILEYNVENKENSSSL